jgi:TonB family protein
MSQRLRFSILLLSVLLPCAAALPQTANSAQDAALESNSESPKWAGADERALLAKAQQGDAGSQMWLASAYEQGWFGKTHLPEALKWFRKSAQQGDPDAQYLLGQMYEDGEGVPQNYSLAAQWYRKAAEHDPDLGGAGHGRYHLGLLYLDGRGVPKNYVQAYMWLRLAGFEHPNLSRIKAPMTPEQILDAERMVEEWKNRHIRQQPQKQDSGQTGTRPKLLNSPFAPYPEEARKKQIEGKVTLNIVVDTGGRVSDATPLSGPPELFQAAIDSVKQWQYEPPTNAPVTIPVEISYGFPKECPGPISDQGGVEVSGRLLNKDGKVVGMSASDDYATPPYPVEDRKAGVSGRMVLSVGLDTEGRVKEIHVVKSLSPHLDEAAMKTVRTWKFKLINENLGDPPNDFQVRIIYRATCIAQF